MSNLPIASSYLSLFDQYKIDLIEVWAFPTELGSVTDASLRSYVWASVVDYDDSNNLTSYAAATGYENCLQTTDAVGHYRCFRPHIAVAAYSGAFNSYKNEPAGWIDSGSPGVVHYGLKFAFNTTAANAITFNYFARFTVSFRNIF